ncbi:MAG: protein kinase domain-containing protein [Candidatus Omnitrophota bacterium]
MIGTIIGNYRILKKIGEGGMGAVFLARDTFLERDVAMKVIAPHLARNPGLMARFRIEAIAQAKLNHANIVTIHSFNQEQDTYYIVMEFVEGKNLKDFILENGPLPLSQALKIFSQILEGMAYAHSRGIIHRDIKTSNIFITPNQVAKIGDFGIAKVEGIDGLTKVGTTLGSPVFSSPEQLMGKKTDARTDIYSLGVVFFEMLTGTLPVKITGNGDYQIIQQILESTPPRPSSLNPSIPPTLDTIILKSIAREPDKRFQSTEAFIEAIKDALPTLTLTPLPSSPRKARKFHFTPNKNQWALIATLSLVLLILIVLLIRRPSPTVSVVNHNNANSNAQLSWNTPQPGSENTNLIPVNPKKGKPGTKQESPGSSVGVTDSHVNPNPEDPADIAKRMAGFIEKTNYQKAIALGLESIKRGMVTGEIYLKLAQAYYFDGQSDAARPYYAKSLDLTRAIRFRVTYESNEENDRNDNSDNKDKLIKGMLIITREAVSFKPHDGSGGNRQFSVPLSRIKSVTQNILSDISGWFKKKKNRKDPVLTIKDNQKNKYVIQVETDDKTFRSFIKDIIDTLRS